MLTERKLNPLILTGLDFAEKEIGENQSGSKPFFYLPALRLQTECYCHLMQSFNVIGVSSQKENIFLKKHLDLNTPVNIIVKNLIKFRTLNYDCKCEFCQFTSKINSEDRLLLCTLSMSNNYRVAARQLGVSEKKIRRKVYTITLRMNISNRRLFHWWISCLRRET